MSLAPAAVVPADYAIMQKPAFGGETSLLVSPASVFELGSVEITGADAGTFTEDATGLAQLLAEPREIVAVIDSEVGGDLGEDVIITMLTMDDTGTPVAMSGVADFSVPGYARNTARVFPVGFGVDLAPQTTGKKYTDITSLVSVSCGAAAKGLKITFFAVPSVSTFVNIGCKTQLEFETKSRVPVNVACGMDGSAFTKPGRSTPGTLSATAKLVNMADGLARYDGKRCTLLAQTKKEGKLIADNTFFIGFIGKVKVNSGDGEDEATLSVQGAYEDLAIACAPTA